MSVTTSEQVVSLVAGRTTYMLTQRSCSCCICNLKHNVMQTYGVVELFTPCILNLAPPVLPLTKEPLHPLRRLQRLSSDGKEGNHTFPEIERRTFLLLRSA